MDGLIDRARKRREMKADTSKGGGDGEERTMGADNNEETGEEKDEKGGRETREEARRGEEDERGNQQMQCGMVDEDEASLNTASPAAQNHNT